MRIVLIAPPWAPVPPRGYGGIEQVVDGLARGFTAAGHDVLLFTTADSTCPVPRRWVLPAAEGQRIGFVVPELRHVLAAYEAVEGYDVVHDHTVAGPLLGPRLTDVPVVTTVHGPLIPEMADLFERIAPHVPTIAISEAQRVPAPHIPVARVIHHGVDRDRYPVGAGDGGYCLFLGRMAPEKGAGHAVAAAQAAGVPLVLAGKMREPLERQAFETEVAPHLGDQVRYVGEVPEEEKLRLLAGARATLFPIRWNEPFGLVMIESLACGTPVLAFPEGAAPEVVEHGRTGYLCRNEAEMTDAIRALDTIDRADCRAAAEQRFSLERMVQQHLDLFAEILAR